MLSQVSRHGEYVDGTDGRTDARAARPLHYALRASVIGFAKAMYCCVKSLATVGRALHGLWANAIYLPLGTLFCIQPHTAVHSSGSSGTRDINCNSFYMP